MKICKQFERGEGKPDQSLREILKKFDENKKLSKKFISTIVKKIQKNLNVEEIRRGFKEHFR